jgi:hypothetical protein
MKNLWDIPNPEPKGDPNETMIYTAVGAALSKWESVEAAAAEIFTVLVGAESAMTSLVVPPAVRAFGIVTSFPTRCEMITTAAKAFFSIHKEVASYERDIGDALSEAREYSNRRNEIAHGVVREVTNSETKEFEGYYLFPSFYNPKRFPVSRFPTYSYVAKNILYFAGRFDVMGQKLDAILNFLVRDLQPKSSVQPNGPKDPPKGD